MSQSPAPETETAKLSRRNRELSILNVIAQELNRQLDLDQSLHTALSQVAELLGLHTGWIWLLDEDSGASYLAAAQDLPPALANDRARLEGTCYCLDTFRSGDLDGAANVNVVACSRLKNLVDGTDGLRYHASIPLYAHGRQLGVLNVASTDWRQLSPGDLRLLYTVGDLLSIAIERARLFARSARLGALEERNRLARELHDTLAQGLAAIALQLELTDALLEDGTQPLAAQQAVQRALTLTRTNLEEARRSVLDLRAAPLEGQSLAEALAALATATAAQNELEVRFSATGGERPLPVRVESSLYRMAQEALSNVVRHAGASRAMVELIFAPGEVHLRIQDDGSGFDVTMVADDRFGLVGLNERARLLGGRLDVVSKPGAGTTLDIAVPLVMPRVDRTG